MTVGGKKFSMSFGSFQSGQGRPEGLSFSKDSSPDFMMSFQMVGEKPAFMFEFLTKRTLNGNSMVIRNFL